MGKVKLSDTELVTQHISNLPKEIQPVVEHLRQIILSVDTEIAEHIKWNSPAFYYSGKMKDFDPKEYKRDILVMNLRKDKIMCVLPTGQSIQKNIKILEGNYTDGRRVINFRDIDDLKMKEQNLKDCIQEWISLIEK